MRPNFIWGLSAPRYQKTSQTSSGVASISTEYSWRCIRAVNGTPPPPRQPGGPAGWETAAMDEAVVTTTRAEGLTAAEVADRVARGQVNDVPQVPSRTIGQIARANIFTY